jgi:long-subunit acyl-CoA synthetase (AMP-forming)
MTLSWAQLAHAIDAVASQIADAGTPGEAPVALALDNGMTWVLADLALVALGRPCLPLPPFFSPQQRGHALADAGASLLAGPPATPVHPEAPVAGGNLILQRLDLPRRPLHAGTAKITYTSGSTGQPKGVCLSQDQLEAVAASLVEVIGAQFAGRHLAALPLGVLLENVGGLYATLMAGGCYHAHALAELYGADGLSPDPRRLVQAAASIGATSLILAPEMLRALTALPEIRRGGRRQGRAADHRCGPRGRPARL